MAAHGLVHPCTAAERPGVPPVDLDGTAEIGEGLVVTAQVPVGIAPAAERRGVSRVDLHRTGAGGDRLLVAAQHPVGLPQPRVGAGGVRREGDGRLAVRQRAPGITHVPVLLGPDGVGQRPSGCVEFERVQQQGQHDRTRLLLLRRGLQPFPPGDEGRRVGVEPRAPEDLRPAAQRGHVEPDGVGTLAESVGKGRTRIRTQQVVRLVQPVLPPDGLLPEVLGIGAEVRLHREPPLPEHIGEQGVRLLPAGG